MDMRWGWCLAGCWLLAAVGCDGDDRAGAADGGGGGVSDGGGGVLLSDACDSPQEATLDVPVQPDEESFEGILSARGAAPSGLVVCADNLRIHRARAESCGEPLPVNPASHCDGFFPDYPEVCVDLDFDRDAGTCRGADCYQRVGCVDDGGCGDGEACVCASRAQGAAGFSGTLQLLSVCVPAGCRSDADCGDQECGAIVGGCGSAIEGFACRTARDACRGAGDCNDLGPCIFSASEARWVCGQWAACE